MLTIETVRRELARLPLLARAGLLGLVGSGIADVVVHVSAPSDGHGHVHAASGELEAHLMGFVSMVVIYLAVVLDGLRQGRNRREADRQRRESPDAVR